MVGLLRSSALQFFPYAFVDCYWKGLGIYQCGKNCNSMRLGAAQVKDRKKTSI